MKNLKEFKSFKLTPCISLREGVTENMLTFNGYVFENKLTNLYSKFNLNEVKRLLKEKLDILGIYKTYKSKFMKFIIYISSPLRIYINRRIRIKSEGI